MFSRAKRFDYYPKREEPLPACTRCAKNTTHNQFNRSCNFSTRSCRSPKNENSTTLRRTHSAISRKTTQTPSVSAETPVQLESPQNSRIPIEVQTVSPEPPKKPPRKPRVTTRIQEKRTFWSSSEESSSENLNRHLSQIETQIEDHRRKVKQLRQSHFASGSSDDGFISTRSTSPADATVDERLSHLENISRLCVRETLEFVTLCNKDQGIQCSLRPQDNQSLVDSCSELARQVAREEGNGWGKVKRFFRRVMRPFKKMSSVNSTL